MKPPAPRSPQAQRRPPLHSGDCLDQTEFHRRYAAWPEDFKAELIGGTVYVASPPSREHGTYHPELTLVLTPYEAATLGVEAGDNMTAILGEKSEPQPDLLLRVLTE